MPIDTQKEIFTKLLKFITQVVVSKNTLYTISNKSLSYNQTIRKSLKGPIRRNAVGYIRLIDVRDRTYKSLLGYDLVNIVDKTFRKNENPSIKTHVLNEVFNMMNFGALSFTRALKHSHKKQFNDFAQHLNKICDDTRTLKGVKFDKCSGEDVLKLVSLKSLESKIYNDDEYYTIFTLPRGNIEFNVPHTSHIIDPMVLDENLDIVYNHTLNNHIRDINDKYDVTLYVKCLIPSSYVNKNPELKKVLEKGHIIQNDIRNPKAYIKGNKYDIIIDKLMNDKGLFENKEYVSKKDYLDLHPYWIITKDTIESIIK